MQFKVLEKYSEALGYALLHRPEVIRSRKQVVQSRIELDKAKSDYLPSLDLQARYYHDDSDFHYSTERENWTMGLVLNWKIFSGLSTKAKVEQSRAILKEMLARDRETTNQIELDVRKAWLKLQEARARLKVTKDSVARAEESYKLVSLQYQGGSSDITRLLNSELDMNRARVRHTAAYYDLQKAKARLSMAMGRLVSEDRGHMGQESGSRRLRTEDG
jgi:outer membrane protein TolC